jgi:hypothetical protein
MAGTIKGKVDCYFNIVGNTYDYRSVAQGTFTSLYNFLLSHPNMTLIARHGGVGGGALNVNYWDQANPFLCNAWCLFRMNTVTENPLYTGTRTFPWYVLVQWNRNDIGAYGVSPGNPGVVDAGTGTSSETRVTLQFAVGIGGTQNPWNGAGTLGTNTKGSTVWAVPSGGTGVLVWPRSNGPGGAHGPGGATPLRHNSFTHFYNASSSVSRSHFMADDDSLVLFYEGGESQQCAMTYFGLYHPRPDFSPAYPMVCLSTVTAVLPFTRGIVYGSTTGGGGQPTNPNNGGGIPSANPATDEIRGCLIDRYVGSLESLSYNLHPNKYFSTPTWDEYPIPVFMWEVPKHFGYAGQIEFIREIGNVESYARNTTGNRIAIGGVNTVGAAGIKISAPWPVGVHPRAGMFREGINF